MGLGSSLGDRAYWLDVALNRLGATPGLTLLRSSRFYRNPPLRGGTARGWFLNAVALFESELDPDALFLKIRAIEEAAGRRRARFWGDRTLDLDVLVVDGVVSDRPELVLPHKGIATRRFVLEPLLEVWPDAINPRTGRLFAAGPGAAGPRLVAWGVASEPRRLYPSPLPEARP